MDCLRSCHSISIRFKSGLWLGHSKTLLFAFLEPFRGGLAGVFGIIVLLNNPSALELSNWWPDILLQDFLIECRIHGSINYGKSSRSWRCKAAPDHHTTTTMLNDKIRLFYLSHTQLYREYITSSEMYSLHLTILSEHTPGAVGSHVTAPGEQLGVRCLAQGHLSRGIEGGYFPPPTIPAGPEIRTHNLPVTSPTRYPLGHDCPNVGMMFFYEMLLVLRQM